MKKIIEGKSYIKINVGLNIVGITKNNLCLIDTIILPISNLYDEITIYENDEKDIVEEVYKNQIEVRELNESHNSFKALKLIKKETNNKRFFRVFIKKNIPLGSGLGGVSGNIAFIMKMINSLYENKVSDTKLISLAASLSYDASFFIFNKPARVTGEGRVFSPISFSIFNYLNIEVIQLPFSISTAKVYGYFRRNFTPSASTIDLVLKYIKNNNFSSLKKVLRNDLKDSIFAISPALKDLYKKYESEDSIILFTGSGSNLLKIKLKKAKRMRMKRFR